MKTQIEQNWLDRMRKDPENYKWGIFYFNPKDPRIMLPKWNQWMGWTLNFANPYSIIFLLAFLAIVIFFSI